MDFFARQDASRRSTRRLVVLFGLAFLTVAIATALVVTLALGMTGVDRGVLSTTINGAPGLADALPAIGFVTSGTLALMVVASLYRSATLGRGGGAVARMLGGTEVHGDATDPLQRRLINVVEEMAIASGLPVPEIYILEQEAGINAFAAGLDHADAAIAVTRGSLEQLNRSELRAVIAHEFSHILNGDMRLNLRLMGFSFGILVLSLIGRWLLRGARFSRSSRNRGGGIVVVALGLVVIGWIGVVLSRLIKAAVSRERESLADASAVQFTREPGALAGALKKIGGFTADLTTVEVEEVSHMMFGRAGPGFRGWFATHPPLVERIRLLEPGFDPADFPPPRPPGQAVGDSTSGAAGFAPDAAHAGEPAAGLAPSAALEDVTVGATGSVRLDSTATDLRGALPETLVAAAHSIDDALLLVAATAVAADPTQSAQQTTILKRLLGDQRTTRCLGFSRELGALDRRLWLPLVEVAVPTLRRRPPAQIEFLLDLLDRLAAADAKHSLFEYVLGRLLKSYLVAPAPPRGAPSPAAAAATVLTVVARVGQRNPASVRAARDAGVAELPQDWQQAAAATPDAADFAALDIALERFARAPAESRRILLTAVERTIRHDGRIGIEEAELLRAIGAAIGCPIPPPRALR